MSTKNFIHKRFVNHKFRRRFMTYPRKRIRKLFFNCPAFILRWHQEKLCRMRNLLTHYSSESRRRETEANQQTFGCRRDGLPLSYHGHRRRTEIAHVNIQFCVDTIPVTTPDVHFRRWHSSAVSTVEHLLGRRKAARSLTTHSIEF